MYFNTDDWAAGLDNWITGGGEPPLVEYGDCECPNCGYDYDVFMADFACPKCGTPYEDEC